VVFDIPIGKNNGTVNGHTYFTCADAHGILCTPHKVKFAVPQSSPLRGAQPEAAAGETDPAGTGGGGGGASEAVVPTSRMNLEDAYKRILALATEISSFDAAKSAAVSLDGGGVGVGVGAGAGAESDDDDEALPDAPRTSLAVAAADETAAGSDEEDEDALPTLIPGTIPIDDDDSSDDDALPELFGTVEGGDSSDDEQLPDIGGASSGASGGAAVATADGSDDEDDDEALPDLGGGDGGDSDDDEALPDVRGTADSVDMEALMRMLKYDASDDTEL
jgi:hypothetical protein